MIKTPYGCIFVLSICFLCMLDEVVNELNVILIQNIMFFLNHEDGLSIFEAVVTTSILLYQSLMLVSLCF